jgi:hypothetical protein
MRFQKTLLIVSVALLVIGIDGAGRMIAFAQDQGSSAPSAAAPAGAGSQPSTGDLPVDEIIRRFAQHESDFKIARDNYTYTQEVLVEDVSPNQGEYRLTSDIMFSDQGKRYEQVTYAPQASLVDFSLSPEDAKDLENVQPFVLTTEDLPKYDVHFTGREKVDELNTYVFQIAPKKIEKGQRYFQGTLWVDDHDFAVVRTDGKAVPDLKDNLFPRFVTYRENIESNFWFPTYTHADDVLHFKTGDVRIRMTVRYKNYKRFGSTVKIGQSRSVDGNTTQAPPNK